MRLTALLLFLGTNLVLAAESASQDATTDDASKLQGSWSIVSVEIDGQSLAMDKLKGARLNIQGTRYSFQLDQTRLELTFKLDASKSPKAIDLEVVEGPEKGKVYHGIYKLEKGRYTICRTTLPGKDRPTEFATRAKSGLMMVVWDQAVVPLPGPEESAAESRLATLTKLYGAGGRVFPLADEALARTFPKMKFFAAQRPVGAVIAGYAHVFVVSKDGKLQDVADARGQKLVPDTISLEKLFLSAIGSIKEEAAGKDSVRAWLRLSQELLQDGFYKFQLIDDSTKVSKEKEGMVASGKVVVTQGATARSTHPCPSTPLASWSR